TSSPSSSGASPPNGGRSARKRAISLRPASMLQSYSPDLSLYEFVRRLALGEQAQALSALHRLGAVAHAELSVHGARVLLDGVLGEVKLLGDLRVGRARGHQRQYRALAVGQAERTLPVVSPEHDPAHAHRAHRRSDPRGRP